MRKKNKRQRIIFISLVFVISVSALIFIIVNFKNNLVFFYSPSELKTAHLAKNKVIRIGGMIEKGSVKNLGDLTTEFVLTDFEERVIVKYRGIKPDLFREEQGMVAKGVWDEGDGVFVAQELLAKHDEKYMPPEVERSLKK